MDRNPVPAIAAAIRNYLAEKPLSADTVEGIQQWWLHMDGCPPALTDTWKALCLLESEGFIERRRVGNRWLWRRPAES